MTVVILSTPGAGNWTVPADWNNADNKIECIAGGGGSGGCYAVSSSGGAGGAAYASVANYTLTPGASINFSVGEGGAGGPNTGGAGQAGSSTWFGAATSGAAPVMAVGGPGSNAVTSGQGNGASGASAASCTGSVTRGGGAGGKGQSGAKGGGGGGAGGPNGAGNAGSGSSSGSGDAGYGGAGSSSSADGGNGTEMGSGSAGAGAGGSGSSASDPGLYGGGAGGRGGSTSGVGLAGKKGAQGVIVITYTPLVAPTITSVSPSSGLLLGGDPVTITGTGFVNVTAVKFGGLDASDVTVVNNTTITCDTPAHTTGTVDVTVTNAAGTGTKSNGFTYNDTPAPAVAPFILGV